MISSPSRARSSSTCAPRFKASGGRSVPFTSVLCAIILACACGASSATAKRLTAANWDAGAQRLVVSAGLMSDPTHGSFNGAAPLSAQAEQQALSALALRLQAGEREAEQAPAGVAQPPAVTSSATITLTRFDELLVDELGLASTAAHVQQVASAAGLEPPSYFGTEVLARYLGLRYDHPAGEDSLELYPWNPITRAEAAHSFAVALEQGAWAVEGARATLEAFSLPRYSASQLAVLRIAVSKIGMPYVWGGTTDGTEDGLDHGGYDCSGFAWRVYKLSGLSWGAKILGRTAAEQAGEIPRSARIHLKDVQPADLLFFGSAHFGAEATGANVIHEGIALSSEWAIHSSGQGVYVLPLTSGWLAQQFTWARRVI
jgi:cell wall-associated NlpC family hydrolase